MELKTCSIHVVRDALPAADDLMVEGDAAMEEIYTWDSEGRMLIALPCICHAPWCE